MTKADHSFLLEWGWSYTFALLGCFFSASLVAQTPALSPVPVTIHTPYHIVPEGTSFPILFEIDPDNIGENDSVSIRLTLDSIGIVRTGFITRSVTLNRLHPRQRLVFSIPPNSETQFDNDQFTISLTDSGEGTGAPPALSTRSLSYTEPKHTQHLSLIHI